MSLIQGFISAFFPIPCLSTVVYEQLPYPSPFIIIFVGGDQNERLSQAEFFPVHRLKTVGRSTRKILDCLLRPFLGPRFYLLGYGRPNPKKKWWFDLEDVDGILQIPNEREGGRTV